MILCKFCNKKFDTPAKYFKHLHQNRCNSRSTGIKIQNANQLAYSEPKKTEIKNYVCMYCKSNYSHKSSLSRHIKKCKEKLALEHILGNNLKQQNMSLDEFITMRDSMENENSNNVENTITINNITNLTNNIQINNNKNNFSINPFGKESYDHIINDKDLCMEVLKAMDNGVNKLFLEIYNKEENRNFYKLYNKKIATLNKNYRINQNNYEYIVELIFNKMHDIYNKIYLKQINECNEKVKSAIEKNMISFNKYGIKSSHKITMDNYLSYMSKENKDQITKYLEDKGIIKKGDKPMLDI